MSFRLLILINQMAWLP